MSQKKAQSTILDYLLIYPDMDSRGLIRKRSVFVSQAYVLIMTVLAWFLNINALFIYGLILLATGLLTTLIYHLKNRKNADIFIYGGFAVGILVSFFFIIRQGGLARSGGLILAGPVIVLLSLIFQRKEWSVSLLGLYLITLVAAALTGHQLNAFPPLTDGHNIIFFTGNCLLLGYLILEMITLLFQKSEELKKASRAMRDRSLSIHIMKSDLYNKLTGPLKSPVSEIQTLAQAAIPEVEPSVRKKLEQIEAGSGYLMNIITQLQDLSLLEADKLKMERIQSDFISFTKYVIKHYKSLGEQKSVSLSFNSNIDQFNLDFDPEKVQTLFSNLLSDALLRCTQKEKIAITVNRERENSFKDFVEIILSDNGKAISQEKINLMIDPENHKWDKDPGSIDWTNLAFNYAGYLVRAMGGKAFIRSKTGGGNRIRIHLPVQNSGPFLGRDEVRINLNIIPFMQPIYVREISRKNETLEEEIKTTMEHQASSKNTIESNRR